MNLEIELLESRSLMASKNIVLIVMDDMRHDLLNAMPRTQRILRDKGVEFVNAYVTTPACCPSRASILTGQYVSSHGVINNHSGSLFDAENSLAPWLDDGGYDTALFGKYLNGYKGSAVPPGWDEWHAFESPSLVTNGYRDFSMNNNGVLRFYDRGYSTDVLKNQAVQFITRKTDDDPFFVAFCPRTPHGPSEPAPRHAKLPVRLPHKPPSYNEARISDKPPWVRGLPRWSAAKQARFDETFRKEIRSLKAADEAVRAIRDAVASIGKLNDTVFIFTSDNGKLWGEHRLSGKFRPHEESLRVPLVIRDGNALGRRQDLVLNIDIAPTILDYADLPAPPSIEGTSLRQPSARDHFFIELFENNVPHFLGVHGQDYVYVTYETGHKEFYNLTTDPFQLRNLAGRIDLTPYQAILDQR